MTFSIKSKRVAALHDTQKLEDVHLGMSQIDTFLLGVVLTVSLTFEGQMDFEPLIDRISDVILSNSSLVRFRSKYNRKTHSWIPVDGWNAFSISICHNDDDDEESWKKAESTSIERFQTLENDFAWICHLKYNPVVDKTSMTWILNHAVGDGYAIRSVIVALLDDPIAQLPQKPKIPFGTSLYHVYNDIRLVKHLRPMTKKISEQPPTASTSPSKQVESIHPIEMPALSLQKIKALAKECGVTTQDLLIHLIAQTKQRIGESEDDWISCSFNHRGLKHLNRMDNVSCSLPIYVGKGDLRTIHRSTKLIKGSSLATYKGYKIISKIDAIGEPPQDRIHSMTNVFGVLGENKTILNRKISSTRFHANIPNICFFISSGPSLLCTFTIEESKRAHRGEFVRKTFIQIAKELNLLFASEAHQSNV